VVEVEVEVEVGVGVGVGVVKVKLEVNLEAKWLVVVTLTPLAVDRRLAPKSHGRR
jgi:hypothetical protein